jgi:hypothetical protein
LNEIIKFDYLHKCLWGPTHVDLVINFLHIGQQLEIGSKKKIVFQLLIIYMRRGESTTKVNVKLGFKIRLDSKPYETN